MRIDLDDRLDKEYPEPAECEINERDCEYRVDHVCHECGAKLCEACSIGIRHQPRLSLYTYETDDGTERIQQHCPNCAARHTLSGRNLAMGVGGVLVGALLAYVGGLDTIALTVIGLAVLTAGAWLTRHEYRLKVRHNDNYGPESLI